MVFFFSTSQPLYLSSGRDRERRQQRLKMSFFNATTVRWSNTVRSRFWLPGHGRASIFWQVLDENSDSRNKFSTALDVLFFFSASEIWFQHPTWAKWVSKTWQIHLTIQIIPKNPSEIFEALLENVVQSWLQQTRDNRAGTRDLQRSPSVVDVMGIIEYDGRTMGMDQYLLIPFLGGWTSIYRLFWCSPELLKCWKSWIGGRGARNELFFWKRWLISGCMTITDECQNFGCCFEGNILFETYKINDRRENKLNQITALRFVVLLENYASIYDNGRSTHEHSQFTSTICGQ